MSSPRNNELLTLYFMYCSNLYMHCTKLVVINCSFNHRALSITIPQRCTPVAPRTRRDPPSCLERSPPPLQRTLAPPSIDLSSSAPDCSQRVRRGGEGFRQEGRRRGRPNLLCLERNLPWLRLHWLSAHPVSGAFSPFSLASRRPARSMRGKKFWRECMKFYKVERNTCNRGTFF